MQSGQSVEAVIMRHDAGAGKYGGGRRQGGSRATLCVSSQVGVMQMVCSLYLMSWWHPPLPSCVTGDVAASGRDLGGRVVQ